MFPLFPVLFPVCSHFSTPAFIVFPPFSVSAARAMSTVSCIPFLSGWNTGNSGNRRDVEVLARPAPWNRRGTTGNKYPWSGSRAF
jgi:hypothetical protein